ncbi:probable plastidic glucose transporter 1 isoform X2 [Phalaenopsis equestris]|uniref:probable plastidic glucose transporter 1 isoform X2 n=1 Tax=Phalaenopsis equestris TaxID=78828 RepID=UPI0009E416DF|nr:probable plastidic glucose transporter 1 isoform X2 [Phalaenopsis equestris]
MASFAAMAMSSATFFSPPSCRFACAPLFLKRLDFGKGKSRDTKGLLDSQATPARELLAARSSKERHQDPGEENLSPLREDFNWDFSWLPAFPHVLTASMANFLFGYHIGVMNGPIEAIAKELGFIGNPILEGLVVSIFIVGAFIGCISSSSLTEKLGCRRTIQIDAIPLIIGALLSAQAHSLDEMLCGRFLVGLGIGVNTVLVPIYISEVSPTRYRGSFGSLCQIGTCLGIIASLSLALPSESDPHWWRSLLLISSGPGLLLMLGMQFAAESPRWLCKVGRLADAERVVRNLWGETNVESSMKEILYVTENINNPKATWLDLLVEPHKKVAFIGGSLFILQQLAGINGVLYFSSLTFSDVGITSGSLASLYVGITNFAGALIALYLMDKQGRKKLLVGSYFGMAFSMFVIALAIISPMDEDLCHTLSVHILLRAWCRSSHRSSNSRTKQCSNAFKNYGLQLLNTLDL